MSMNGQLTQMCSNFNLIFLWNYTVYEHAVFTVRQLSNESSINVSTHSNTKGKPGKMRSIVKLPAVKMFTTDVVHNSTAQIQLTRRIPSEVRSFERGLVQLCMN